MRAAEQAMGYKLAWCGPANSHWYLFSAPPLPKCSFSTISYIATSILSVIPSRIVYRESCRVLRPGWLEIDSKCATNDGSQGMLPDGAQSDSHQHLWHIQPPQLRRSCWLPMNSNPAHLPVRSLKQNEPRYLTYNGPRSPRPWILSRARLR